MKKLLPLMILGTIILLLVLVWKYNTSAPLDSEQINHAEVPNESAATMSGYYYFGLLDEREKMDDEAEKDYFYHMDRYFQDYQKSKTISLGSDEEQLDEEVLEYFTSIDGLSLYSLPRTGLKINDGDYITFIVTSPIKESYPAQIDEIEQLEISFSRMP